MDSLVPAQSFDHHAHQATSVLQTCEAVVRNEGVDDDPWEKALQLAYFLLPERAVALNVLREALTKLEVQRTREYKRRYWRDKNMKGMIRRITREQRDALQWLIYLESEVHEKRQEHAGTQTLDDMIVRYVKHLVQITTSMSSLYVQIGLHRLLHDYSTPEVRQVYEWLTGHHPGYAQYRKVKSTLMDNLQTRFKDGIRVVTAERRELKFEVAEQQEAWAGFVDECLVMFVPWSTAQACPTLANLGSRWTRLLEFLSTRGYRFADQDPIETKRCHVFIDPACYGEVTRKLGMDHPHKRLAIPKFYLSANSNGGPTLRRLQGEDRHLSEEERTTLAEHLQAQARLREQISPKLLTFMAHGEVCGQFDLTRSQVHSFEIRHGVKLIEVWGEDVAGKALFAAHTVRYREWQGIAPETALLDLGHETRLWLHITPKPRADEATGALVQVKCVRNGLAARAQDWLASSFAWGKPWPKYAVAGLLLTLGVSIGWIAGKSRSDSAIAQQRAQVEHMRKELATLRSGYQQNAMEATSNAPVFRLVPDKISIREQGKSEPIVTIPPGVALVLLELPIYEQRPLVYRAVLTPFLEAREMISEDGLSTMQVDRRSVVTFALPASLVENNKDYVLHLHSRDALGHPQDLLNFTFYIEKK
jgi:hypothetical protein